MKRLNGVLPVIMPACLALAGCQDGLMEADWWDAGASANRDRARITSEVIVDPPGEDVMPETADATVPGASADEDDSLLAERIRSYVGRFPVDDLASKVEPDDPAPEGHAGTAGDSSRVGLRIDLREGDTFAPHGDPSVEGAFAPREDRHPPSVSSDPADDPRRSPARVGEAASAAAHESSEAPSVGGVRPNSPRAMDAVESHRPPEPLLALPESTDTGPRAELIDVRPGRGGAAQAGASDTVSAAPNQPIHESEPGAGRDVPSLIAELERSIAENPRLLDEQFRLRLLYLATGQDEKAAEQPAGVDPVHGELVSTFFRALGAMGRAVRDPSQPVAGAVEAVGELDRLLRQRAPVMIPRIALVTRINSFGDYVAVDPPRFAAGQGVHVFVYTEVANYRSEPTGDGRLRTSLAQKVEVFDQDGEIIWEHAEPVIEDRTLSPRRDFFIPFEMRLDPDTPPGEYVVKVTIEDKLGATTDQHHMRFTIEP